MWPSEAVAISSLPMSCISVKLRSEPRLNHECPKLLEAYIPWSEQRITSPLCNVIARTFPIFEHLQRINHEYPFEFEYSIEDVEGLYRIISDPFVINNDITILLQFLHLLFLNQEASQTHLHLHPQQLHAL